MGNSTPLTARSWAPVCACGCGRPLPPQTAWNRAPKYASRECSQVGGRKAIPFQTKAELRARAKWFRENGAG